MRRHIAERYRLQPLRTGVREVLAEHTHLVCELLCSHDCITSLRRHGGDKGLQSGDCPGGLRDLV